MAPTIRTIGTYATHEKHCVDFFGDDLIVTVTADPSVIGQWIHDALSYDRSSSHPLVVGVGVNWKPASRYYDLSSGRYYFDSSPGNDPPANTLQLCVGNRCIIIQLSHCDRVPKILRKFFANRDFTFVGFCNSQDAGKLERSRHQLDVGKLLDLRKYVEDHQGIKSLSRCSFEELIEECMSYHYHGVRLDPDISMSDWSLDNLFYAQILQASIDVYVCFELGVRYSLWEY